MATTKKLTTTWTKGRGYWFDTTPWRGGTHHEVSRTARQWVCHRLTAVGDGSYRREVLGYATTRLQAQALASA